MEKLFHYAWEHRLLPLTHLYTTKGQKVEVVDIGSANHNAGPDFCNAKIYLGGQLWVGNVELHLKASQWTQHGHHTDKAYNNVILHVVTEADNEIFNEQGQQLPQVVIPLPDQLKSSYTDLLHEERYPRCHRLLHHLSPLMLRDWLSYLCSERLARKAQDILTHLTACNGSWEEVCFRTLARSFGFGLNAEPFEQWAKSIPLNSVAHHRDSLFQVEAIFFGQAGLLDSTQARPAHRARMDSDDYFQRLATEYRFLAHKFGLTPIAAHLWRFLRLRPQSFPTIRLAQLAQLYCNNTAGMSQLMACTTVKDVERALYTHVSPYWQTHYLFGEQASTQHDKHLSNESVKVIIINTIVPLLYAYGTFRQDKHLKERAFHFMEQLPSEKNNIIRLWRECGVSASSAHDSQALIQLKNEYCDRKNCLRCRIGCYLLKKQTIND